MTGEKKLVIEGMNQNKLIDNINNKLNSSKDLYKALEKVLFVIAVFQIAAIVFFNIFQMPYHLGFDASSIMLKARMIWEQKTLFPADYAEQTNLFFDSSMPVAALIYGLCGDICLAFGITNVLSTFCIAFLFYFISGKIHLSKIGTLFGSIFLLTPYVSPYYNTANPIDYFPAMFFSSSFMSVMTIYTLLVFAAVIYLSDKNSNKTISVILSVISVLMSFYLAISRGIAMFLYVVAPIFLYLIVKTLANKDLRCFFNRVLVFALLVCAAILAGTIYVERVIGFSAKGSSIELISLGDFWINFGSIFLGLGKLLNVGNAYGVTTVASLQGLVYLIRVCVLAVYLFGIVFSIVQIVKKQAFIDNDGLCYTLAFCFVNFFAYALINSTYGAAIFEERYLILFFVFSLFLLGYFIDTFNYDFFKKIGILISAFVIFGSSISSYYFMDHGKNPDLSNMSALFSKYDEKVVYAYNVPGGNLHILARDLRVLDKNKVYKLVDNGFAYHWGDYTYYDDLGDEPGAVLLLIEANQFEALPEYCKSNFVFSESYGNYEIYKSQKNVFDFETGLDDDGYSIDLPYTYGVATENCNVNEAGVYETNGTEGFCLYGPNAPTMAGNYRITLHYNVRSCADGNIAGSFDVATNIGTSIKGSESIRSDSDSVSIDVSFSDGEAFEYRVWSYQGSIIEIESIEMEKIN